MSSFAGEMSCDVPRVSLICHGHSNGSPLGCVVPASSFVGDANNRGDLWVCRPGIFARNMRRDSMYVAIDLLLPMLLTNCRRNDKATAYSQPSPYSRGRQSKYRPVSLSSRLLLTHRSRCANNNPGSDVDWIRINGPAVPFSSLKVVVTGQQGKPVVDISFSLTKRFSSVNFQV